jgi:hypothetical protein
MKNVTAKNVNAWEEIEKVRKYLNKKKEMLYNKSNQWKKELIFYKKETQNYKRKIWFLKDYWMKSKEILYFKAYWERLWNQLVKF